MTEKTLCMNQVFRPKNHVPTEGVGNCTMCQKDEKNKMCKNYKPMKLFTGDED